MKTVFTSLFLLFSAVPAHALQEVKTPFTLHCHGSDGFVFFQQTAEGMHYEVNLANNQQKGFVLPYQVNGLKWQQGSATIIEPVYQKSKWLSVSAIHGDKVWHPPSKGCMPTRNTDAPCHLVQKPGYYSNNPTEWTNLMVDLSVPGKVSFISLDPVVGGAVKTLGTNTSCTAEGLEPL